MVDNLAELVKLFFQRVSIERLFTSQKEQKVYYNSVDVNYLLDLRLTYASQISDTEVRMQIQEVTDQTRKKRNKRKEQKDNSIDVFDLLFYYVPELLTFCENRCICRYDKLLQWDQLVKAIGEELPVIARIVQFDYENRYISRDFLWEPVIGHNNNRLNRILQKGMADNHCHLRGASPYYIVSWMNLMNNPKRMENTQIFQLMEKNQRDKRKKSETMFARQPLRILVLRAALIRLYLCSRLVGFSINLSSNQKWRDKADLTCQERNHILEKETWEIVQSALEDDVRLERLLSVLQAEIDVLCGLGNQQDYMIQFVNGKCSSKEEVYVVYAGERWFMYSMMMHLYTGSEKLNCDEYNLFYAYLRIKNELYTELIQVNDIVGFENFQIIQGRKDAFSHGKNWIKSEEQLAKLAIRPVLDNPAIRYLEVRISPQNTAKANKEAIQTYDNAIIQTYDKHTGEDVLKDELRKHFHYVFHFPKIKDKKKDDYSRLECRHYEYRKNLKKKANAIIKLRENYPEFGRRVVGIDACAQEIGCRPEVFARVFRTLKNHIVSMMDIDKEFKQPQLKITYHVGEEFLDVVDGLRAVDEAIRFLGLDCGDRIGHGTVLGIDVEQWYTVKNHRITLTLQDYLDNIVWMHHALVKYNLKNMDALKGWLEESYSQYFAYIFQPCMNEMTNEHTWEKISRHKYIKSIGNFDINTYYLSWILRGDQPSLYKAGRFEEPEDKIDQWNRYAINKRSLRIDDIRYIHEVSLLYYMYHYSSIVREKGAEIKTFALPDKYIEGVVAIQRELREEIVKRGIAIETNPTSNVRISTMNRYSEHPIKVLYNQGLTYNEVELLTCPQMNVSINTDDSGVFATKLENEYALMACSLENENDENGNPKYKKEFIYTWLDNIREMGLRQIFAEPER